MRHIYKIFLLIVACAFFAITNGLAQDFPWPDLGTPMIIEPGAPGTFDNTIMGDTAADGTRNHQHYILRRGEIYLYIYDVNNVDWDLMVTAEEGDGPLPILKALGIPPGGDEAPRPFTAQGNIYLQGLNIKGIANDGLPTDNATIRLNDDNLTGVIKNCIIDYNRQQTFRLNSPGCELYIENTLLFGEGNASNIGSGEAIHFRGNFAKMVHLRNNTWVNMVNKFCENRNTKEYGTFIVDHNTIVNTGANAADLGRPDTLVWTNNLIVNPMILGTGWDGDRDRFEEPLYAFDLDSNFVESVFDPPVVTFENNWIYVDPAVTAFLPDSSDGADQFMFEPILNDIVKDDASVKIIKEAFPFTNSVVNTSSDYQAFIDDYYTAPPIPADLPGFGTDPTTLDFGYSDTHPAYTGGADGKPLGDLNWHDLSSGIWDKLKQVNMNVYPNPVKDYFVVELGDQEMTQVDIINVLGQSLYQVNVQSRTEVLVNASNLEKGIYFVRCFNNNKLLGTYKITK